MEILLNTANPIIIIMYTLIISGIIYLSKRTKKPVLLIVLVIGIIAMLVFHTISLEKINSNKEESISDLYHSIATDLVFLFLVFISYLWVDDIRAKDKKLKSYDDSLGWFWNKI